MGKTPKKATPGGDERNLYNRTLRRTTAPPNPSETSLHKRQRKSKISNRSTLSTLGKKVPSNPRKFKSKIQRPMKVELEHSAKQATENPDKIAGSSKEKKSAVSQQSEESNSAKMQPESEEADPKLNPTVQVEYIRNDSSKDKMKVELECFAKQATGNSDKTAGSFKEKKSVVPQQSEESNSTKMQLESEETNPKLNPTVQMEYIKNDSSKDKMKVELECFAKHATGNSDKTAGSSKEKKSVVPQQSEESNYAKMQLESEETNPKLNPTVQVEYIKNGSSKDKMKVELERFAKQATGNSDKTAGSSKEKKSVVPQQSEESNSAKMQLESEETNPKLNPTVQMEYIKNDSSKDTQESNKGYIGHTFSEPISVLKTQNDLQDAEVVIVKEQLEWQDKASNSDKKQEDCQENNLNLHIEIENDIENAITEKTDDIDLIKKNDEKCPSEQAITKDDIHEKEDLQSESQTDTESNSADIIEFTTSEISEASETLSQNDIEKEKEKEKETEKAEESISKNISFVSYDPSIMLKDVQIRLNDCLKENSKLFNTSNASRSMSAQSPKDMSFGKTLRSISGRRSLSRMRHVTLREYRYSPSDSMFVNTSSASLPPDETVDFKILRYSTDLSDTLSTTNGSPTERKRKLDTEDWNSMKRQKVETENSLLHSPISLLKGLRKPIQVSTPVSDLKFKTGRLELDENTKPANEGSKKWCAIM